MKPKKPPKKAAGKPARPRGRPRKAPPEPAAAPAAAATEPAGTTLLCWQCGAEVSADDHACRECHADLDEGAAKHQVRADLRCPDCGAHWEHGETICPECGCSAYDEPPETDEEELW